MRGLVDRGSWIVDWRHPFAFFWAFFADLKYVLVPLGLRLRNVYETLCVQKTGDELSFG